MLIAHMRGVDAANIAQQFGERHDLIDVGGGIGFVPESGTEADRACIQTVTQQVPHRIDLASAGFLANIFHRTDTKRLVPDQRSDVDSRRSRIDRLRIVLHPGEAKGTLVP